MYMMTFWRYNSSWLSIFIWSLTVCSCMSILQPHFYCYITALCQHWIKGVTYILTLAISGAGFLRARWPSFHPTPSTLSLRAIKASRSLDPKRYPGLVFSWREDNARPLLEIRASRFLSFFHLFFAGVIICLGRVADLHMAQLQVPLPLTVSCSRKSRLVLVLPLWYRPPLLW